MKNRVKLLPVAVAASLLVGCGGGESGGGGGAIATSYSYEFLKSKVNVSAADLGTCTVYQRNIASNTFTTYHTIGTALDNESDAALVAYYSNADGSRAGELITSSGGELSFTYQTIPDDGYVSIQERDGNKLYVTSFSKAFLQRDTSLLNAKFGVNRSISGTSCVTGNNFSNKTVDDLSYLTSDVSGSSGENFIFQSQLESYTDANSIQSGTDRLTAFSPEPTFIKQMNGTELQQYAFANWSDDGSGNVIMNGVIDTLGTITRQTGIKLSTDNSKYADIDVSLIGSGYSYTLNSYLESANTFKRPSATNGETWAFAVTGDTDILNWKAEYYSTVDTQNWDMNVNDNGLYSTVSLADNPPLATSSGSTITISLTPGGVDFTDKTGVQRVSYSTSYNGNEYTLIHNVYTLLDDSISLPEVEYFDYSDAVKDALKATSATSYRQDYMILADNSAIENADFMGLFSHGDGSSLETEVNGIVRTEVEENTSSVRMQSNEHIRLYRDN